MIDNKMWLDRLEESLVEPFYNNQTEAERNDGFKDTLSFGTAGIRSTFGIGPGRLNAFTVRKVAYGLAKYMVRQVDEPTIVIHYDTRFLSQDFAKEMASVLAINNVKVIISKDYKSTPELSFAVRNLEADAGIMITASHNPKQYNGIKVYNKDGGQLLPEPSEELSVCIDEIDNPLALETQPFNQLLEQGLIQYLPEEVTDHYKAQVRELVGRIDSNHIKTVLTSLHGTSLPVVADILKSLDYDNFVIEETQSRPDGDFPTVERANPEELAAFDLGVKLADRVGAELIIATDPDADRFGFIERYEDGSSTYFNGNEIGLIMMKLRYQEALESGQQLYMAKSIVTSELAERFGDLLGVEVNNVLTGFKYISELLESKSQKEETLLLAFEESHGYLAAPFSRDKDAIQMVPLVIKYKNLLADNGLTFKDTLDDIYRQIGEFKDITLSPKFEGTEGKSTINAIMDQFRGEQVLSICGLEVQSVEDYEAGVITHVTTGEQQSLSLPHANLIRFIFKEGFIALRPSGTEPKIKLYFSLEVDDINHVAQEFKRHYVDSVQ
ncbi:phospho-sugar mutase [Staphylococcus sp. SQ8-PEA]|uniref:Phosphoglucomutase n=1 Tax=Staphylococcus marylandisciuri TaxID=2981529 RepID=A0ABT2QPZ3_9STAP|nr:phospho-sugar mutase [Staphylococcus marylandisciuri]MCU5746037.1 phospho-sugar mutase [Staphylococcus marylandisciuri]